MRIAFGIPVSKRSFRLVPPRFPHRHRLTADDTAATTHADFQLTYKTTISKGKMWCLYIEQVYTISLGIATIKSDIFCFLKENFC